MTEVLISEFMAESAVTELSNEFETLYDPALAEDRKQLVELTIRARALIVRNRTQVDGELLSGADDLEIIGRLGVGVDNIDTEACDTRGIQLVTGAGLNATAVSEYVIGAMMWSVRGLGNATSRMVAGEWPRQSFVGSEIAGRTLGLVGFGEIARAVALRAVGLGMRVVAHDPFVEPDPSIWGQVEPASLDELLAESDVVSLHVPLSEETRRLFDEERVHEMKRGAILVNTSRGGIVDEVAVTQALQRGHLGGAVFDVFDEEPLTAEGAKVFADTPNIVLTPHIAGVTQESETRIADRMVQAVREKLRPGR